MSQNSPKNNRITVFIGLGMALVIAIALSPFASKDPDGLDRVSEDLKFDTKATENPPAEQLPFSQVFDEYSFKGIKDEKGATAIAGLIGTLTTFGLAWGIGKLATRSKAKVAETDDDSDRPQN